MTLTIVLSEPQNIDEFQRLAGIGFTITQIAKYFSIDPVKAEIEYLQNMHFQELYDDGILKSKESIALAAEKEAKKGNVAQAQRLDNIQKEIIIDRNKKIILYGEGS